MSGTENLLGIVKDVVLPLDAATRYDLYFTDKRVAIVCMGRADRFEEKPQYNPLTFIAPTTTTCDNKKRISTRELEEQLSKLSLDELLKLSKKSCFYTYDEVEEVKLAFGKKLRFAIFSKDCESKFSPNEEQFKQLSDLLPTIDALKDKLSISGSWKVLQENAGSLNLVCEYCGFESESDAAFCQGCGKKIEEKTTTTEPSPEMVCGSCGTRNKMQASFCKKGGSTF